MREYGAPSEHDGQPQPAWQQQGKLLARAKYEVVQQPWGRKSVSQVQVGGTQSRGVSTEVIVAALFLWSRTYLSCQNPVSSKADSCGSSSNSSSLQVCILSARIQATVEL